MKVVDDEAYEAFAAGLEQTEAVRIKHVRDRALMPGGRTKLRMFEAVDGRPHPRIAMQFPPAVDPAPPTTLFDPEARPRLASEVLEEVQAAFGRAESVLSVTDLDPSQAPAGSPKYWRNSIRAQRLERFFREARAALDGSFGSNLSAEERDASLFGLRRFEDRVFSGVVEFDDADTGTYHSYGHDEPFVHYLEEMLESLPVEGSEAMAVLPPAGREAVRRQREQAQAHLDHLMRHKYAYEVVQESNIEKTVGGLLIDRIHRQIVSEVRDDSSLTPQYELLRIDPTAQHPHAGAWVHRDEQGALRLDDGTSVDVEADRLRAAPVDPSELTFRRANHSPLLRSGVRLDWDGNGHVQAGRIDWVSWAGHCDIKAVMEQLGIVFDGTPSVTEYRSDVDTVQTYDRRLLLEMFASALELGSTYRRLDGTGRVYRGIHSFGGARNDSRPDRIQFTGPAPGRGFRWPLTGRQEDFVVRSITWADGEKADMGTVFYRDLPDVEGVDFRPNPRYMKTVEGDYNLISVAQARLEVSLQVDVVDPATGYLGKETRDAVIDLRPEAEATGEHDGRFFLGTHVDSAAKRRIFEVYFDLASAQIEAELFTYEKTDAGWTRVALPGESVRLPMATPLQVTLSREMKRDDPAAYRTLLDVAIRQAKNICADTDEKAAVWNGVVTRIESTRRAVNEDARVEHWEVDVKARFGSAKLSFLMRRDAQGEPVAWCPAIPDDAAGSWPDFLWHDIPDVGSKGRVEGAWVVNETMLERGIVGLHPDPSVEGEVYVHDEHIKNVFEVLFCGLDRFPYTVVHGDKRYGFSDRATWEAAVDCLRGLRSKLTFVE